MIWPSELAHPSQIIQKLTARTANFILRNPRRKLDFPWCRKMPARFELPATVHHHAHYHGRQRGGYDLNIWSRKKRLEKLNTMHNNPLKRRLVENPGDWLRPSGRFYYLGDESVLAMGRMP